MAGIGFDWIVSGFSLWFIGGLYLDGWAHLHVPHLETFFTPWHAVLYSGFLAVATVLVVTWVRNRAAGYVGWAMPAGYELPLLGAVIFAVGGVGDMIWHTLFGIEVDLDALLVGWLLSYLVIAPSAPFPRGAEPPEATGAQ